MSCNFFKGLYFVYVVIVYLTMTMIKKVICEENRKIILRLVAGIKNNCRILSQHDEKHVVPTPLSVGKGRKKKKLLCKYVGI
jgi:hypothetical protein